MGPRPRIGTTIRRARERKRMTQQQVADLLGVSRASYDAWENDRAYPRSSIGALEEVLGVSLDGEPAAPEELVPADEWEAWVLAHPDIPDHIRRDIVLSSRARSAPPRRGDQAAAGPAG